MHKQGISCSRWAVTSLCFLFSFVTPRALELHSRDSVFPHQTTSLDLEKGPPQDVHNETLGFRRIFLLSPPGQQDLQDTSLLSAQIKGLRLDYIDVTPLSAVLTDPHHGLSPGSLDLGYTNRQSHIRALRTIVEQNLESALILENDADWSVRIKAQMQAFAEASRLIVQPRIEESEGHTEVLKRDNQAIEDLDLSESVPQIMEPISSPYGDVDRWDMLWFGHCGTRFLENSDNLTPMQRIVFSDKTVPEPQHIDMPHLGQGRELKRSYSEHTRAVHRTAQAACTTAYAVSLLGAKRLLQALDSSTVDRLENVYSDACAGADGEAALTCLTAQPQLFSRHKCIEPDGEVLIECQQDKAGFRSKNKKLRDPRNLRPLVSRKTNYMNSFLL